MVTQPLRAGIRLAAAPGRRQAHSSEELRGSKAGLALPRLRPLRLHDDRTSNWTEPPISLTAKCYYRLSW